MVMQKETPERVGFVLRGDGSFSFGSALYLAKPEPWEFNPVEEARKAGLFDFEDRTVSTESLEGVNQANQR